MNDNQLIARVEKAEKDIAVLNSLKNIKQFLVSLKESL